MLKPSKMNAMKKCIFQTKRMIAFGGFLLVSISAFPQSETLLTLDTCYAIAQRNYPLVKQMSLIEKAKDYSIENTSKSYLPQFSINGQATYQSEVTEFPVKLPNVLIDPVSKDQYKIYGEIIQPITDLFTISTQKEMVRTTAEIEHKKTEVELYKLKDRITNLYFGILLIDGQLRQTDLLKKDIQSGIDKTKAAIANGTALKSNIQLLQAELLKADQRNIELLSNRKAYKEMLSLFLSLPLNENILLQTPTTQVISEQINRPEQKLFELQKKTFDIQKKLLTAKYFPKANLFLQGGYGRPALNMLNNELNSYYFGGLRLNWNITGYYTLKKEKKILELNQYSYDIQNETFLFNTKIILTQQNIEVNKYEQLISKDNEIILLRENIKTTSKVQLEFGAITAIDYLTNINAEDQAKQNLLLHQIQLLLAEYNSLSTSGN